MYVFDIVSRIGTEKYMREANSKIIGNKISSKRENNIKMEERIFSSNKEIKKQTNSPAKVLEREIKQQCARENISTRNGELHIFGTIGHDPLLFARCIRKNICHD